MKVAIRAMLQQHVVLGALPAQGSLRCGFANCLAVFHEVQGRSLVPSHGLRHQQLLNGRNMQRDKELIKTNRGDNCTSQQCCLTVNSCIFKNIYYISILSWVNVIIIKFYFMSFLTLGSVRDSASKEKGNELGLGSGKPQRFPSPSHTVLEF